MMNMNRRNVIVGLGTVVVGGGAALGSGAFSSTSAERTLEVNVVTGEQIAEDFVDVILNNVGGIDTLGVDDDGEDDATALFPETDITYDGSGHTTSANDVSLMQNDVTIVFGPDDNELPPNSNVEYDELITIVNEEGDGTNFEVTFNVSVGDGDSDLTFDPANQTVNENNTGDVDVTVDTGSDDVTDGTLTIEIKED
ncbi:hypothetical protein [Natronorubrum sp. DTA28]|uniref:hypothetical protein n=1 Tax=Natronorubrum sp. DTA28 TaxID=3447019 RepID=UPI003F83CF84